MTHLLAGIDAATERFRRGRKVGRTLYVHTADNPDGRLIGVVDTPELAALICDAVNAHLETQHERTLPREIQPREVQ